MEKGTYKNMCHDFSPTSKPSSGSFVVELFIRIRNLLFGCLLSFEIHMDDTSRFFLVNTKN